MPKCSCGRSQTKLNDGDLCKQCYAAANEASENDGRGFDTTKSVAELSIGELMAVIQHTVNPIVSPLKEKITGLENKIEGALAKINDIEATSKDNSTKIKKYEEATKHNSDNIQTINNEVDGLKNIILEQQKYLEAVKKMELSNILSISLFVQKINPPIAGSSMLDYT